jgi:hypothetical protein
VKDPKARAIAAAKTASPSDLVSTTRNHVRNEPTEDHNEPERDPAANQSSSRYQMTTTNKKRPAASQARRPRIATATLPEHEEVDPRAEPAIHQNSLPAVP